jgi:hypothetical protein
MGKLCFGEGGVPLTQQDSSPYRETEFLPHKFALPKPHSGNEMREPTGLDDFGFQGNALVWRKAALFALAGNG